MSSTLTSPLIRTAAIKLDDCSYPGRVAFVDIQSSPSRDEDKVGFRYHWLPCFFKTITVTAWNDTPDSREIQRLYLNRNSALNWYNTVTAESPLNSSEFNCTILAARINDLLGDAPVWNPLTEETLDTINYCGSELAPLHLRRALDALPAPLRLDVKRCGLCSYATATQQQLEYWIETRDEFAQVNLDKEALAVRISEFLWKNNEAFRSTCAELTLKGRQLPLARVFCEGYLPEPIEKNPEYLILEGPQTNVE